MTHILCTHLPHGKTQELLKKKMVRGAGSQTPIIHPNFVLDCINQKRLLPHAPYLLEALKNRFGSNIKDHVSKSSNRKSSPGDHKKQVPCGASSPSPSLVSQEPVVPIISPLTSQPSRGSHSMDHHLLGENEDLISCNQKGVISCNQSQAEGASIHHQPLERPQPSLPTSAPQSPSNTCTPINSQISPPPPPSKQKVQGGYGHIQSTKEDPQFIKKFYQQSRLHFIGTWRMHYQEIAAEKARNKMLLKKGASKSQNTQSSVSSQEADERGRAKKERSIIHVDMDCFFVSVLIRDRPDLWNKPVAVAHSMGAKEDSCSEISSCNYVAREKGVKASMWMHQARELCPNLVVLSYDFEKYEEVSDQVYEIFFEEAETVQAVSCDEAYLQLPNGVDGLVAATRIRDRIFQATKCTASAGISSNMLLARMATKKAKPNGQYWLKAEDAHAFLDPLEVSSIPGVGWNLKEKLFSRGLKTVAQVRQKRLSELQEWYGVKTGKMLYDSCRGIDAKELQPISERKSLGAEVNWGVRFSQDDQVKDFLGKLAEEVASRLALAKVKGRTVTFKLKRSKYGNKEPPKFLGCGDCDNFSRSCTLKKATDDKEEILEATLKLYEEIRCSEELIRGLGIQLTRLEGENKEDKGLKAWLRVQGGDVTDLDGEKLEGAMEDEWATEEYEQKEGYEGRIEEIAGQDSIGFPRDEQVPKSKGEPSRLVAEFLEEETEEANCKIGDSREGVEAGHGKQKMLLSLSDSDEDVEILSSRKRAGGEDVRPSEAATLDASDWQPTLSQVDPAVLPDLPPEIREELMTSMAHRGQHGQPSEVVDEFWPTLSQADPSVLKDLPSFIHMEYELALKQRKAEKIALPEPVLPEPAKRAGSRGASPALKRSRTKQPSLDSFRQLSQLKSQGLDEESLEALPLHLRLEVAKQAAGFVDAERISKRDWDAAGGSKKDVERGRKDVNVAAKARSGSHTNKHREVIDLAEEPESTQTSGKGGMEEAPARDGAGEVFMIEDCTKVRNTMLTWLKTIASPSAAHLNLLCEYLSMLVRKKRLEDLWSLMRGFKRFAYARSPIWIEAYEAVLASIQQYLEMEMKREDICYEKSCNEGIHNELVLEGL